jgi:hypothetical protein
MAARRARRRASFEGIGRRGVLGGGGPQARDQALHLATPTARLGELERLARDVAGVGEAPVALEDGGQAIECLGGLGAPSEGGQHIGAAVHRALVRRRPVQRQPVRGKRLVGSTHARQDATETDPR